jgi:carbamoyltransferase
MGEVRDGDVRLFEKSSISVNHSLALLFGEITRYLGFMPNNDEYKVMGLAAFAPPPSDNPLLEHVVELHEDGRYSLALANDPSGTRGYYPLLDRLFDGDERRREETEFRATVAAAAQQMVEVVTAHQLRALEAGTDLTRLIYEGGLALNCVNNAKLLENSRFTDIHVSFGASDPGVAIGAAVYAGRLKGRSRPGTATPYLGPSYDDEQMLSALREHADRVEWTELDEESVAEQTAKLLSEKTVIGWFQGRAEYGPRALGHRSLLAHPGHKSNLERLNDIKGREQFRPVAPMVLADRAAEIFTRGPLPSPYMLFVHDVAAAWQDRIPAVVHVDGTARVQTVDPAVEPLVARMLTAFEERAGLPVVVNTSLNTAGRPMVDSPRDALECFGTTPIDLLAIGPFVLRRPA